MGNCKGEEGLAEPGASTKLGRIVAMRMVCCGVKLQMRGLGGSVAGFLRLGGQLLRSVNFNAT